MQVMMAIGRLKHAGHARWAAAIEAVAVSGWSSARADKRRGSLSDRSLAADGLVCQGHHRPRREASRCGGA